MADLSLDELLANSFKRVAEPANSAGVADAIRSRVSAGDAGTSVSSVVAPGWEGAARPAWFWPMLGAITALTVTLVILISTVVLGSPSAPMPVPVETETSSPTPNPSPTPTRTPTPTPTPTPEVAPPPPPPRDTASPTIKAGQWSPNTVYPPNSGCQDVQSDTLVSSTDNVGVTSLTAASSLANTSVTLISSSASGTIYRFVGTWPPSQSATPVTVTFTAQDAAGNVASVATSLTNGFSCVIIT